MTGVAALRDLLQGTLRLQEFMIWDPSLILQESKQFLKLRKSNDKTKEL